jgi:hypothetical protein
MIWLIRLRFECARAGLNLEQSQALELYWIQMVHDRWSTTPLECSSSAQKLEFEGGQCGIVCGKSWE